MALFFDGTWFNEKLAGLGLSRAMLAQALGLSDREISEVWKDQRELSAREVAIIAALLGTTGEEIAERAGIATPVPRAAQSDGDIAQRLSRIEQALVELTRLVRELGRR